VSLPEPRPTACAFPAVLTHREAMVERERLVRAVVQGCDRIDMSALSVFDSSALAVMLACLRAQGARGRAIVFEGAPEKLRNLAGLYGLQDILADAFD
jgi:phospholipid transport system transporter-binding protein